MDLKIISFYCLCDVFLISQGWSDDPQCAMSTAEVMTTAAFFSGNYEKSRIFLEQHRYVPAMLSKNQFIRHLCAIPESVWSGLMQQDAVHHLLQVCEKGELVQQPTSDFPRINERSKRMCVLHNPGNDSSATWPVSCLLSPLEAVQFSAT